MSKVSIIIPARSEKWENLNRTIQSIYENATGEFEVIIGYDGTGAYRFDYPLNSVTNLKVIDFPDVVGIKTNINAMAAMATGKYIYKSDAHCSFGKGFDEILQQDMQPDWIVMPRFKIIKDDWSIQMRNGEEEFYDYLYLSCPFTDPKGFRFKAGGHWPERTKERLYAMPIVPFQAIDETPQIHGSGWFMTKDRYFELGGFPNIDPYGHAQEPIWLALKNWLMGGKVMVNKRTWYAHLHQNHQARGYSMDRKQENLSYNVAATTFLYDRLCGMKHNFSWFVNEKFPNMPTWPKNWEELFEKYRKEHPENER